MRIGYDATSAINQQAGIGRYVRELLGALLRQNSDDAYTVVAASEQSGIDNLQIWLPPGSWREFVRLPVSERYSTIFWHRFGVPINVERFTGPLDLFHGPDFVVPPSKCPSIVTVHDTSYLKYPEFSEPPLVEYLRQAVPRALSRASGIICVSAAVAADVAEAYPETRDRLIAIPNGVRHPENLDIEPSAVVSEPDVLIVGTVQPRKNHLGLLDAMVQVRHHYPDARLTIVGRAGWKSADIIHEIRKRANEGWVTWISDGDDQELERRFRKATLVACPSFDEGFGLPILEAQIRRLPVVCSDLPVFHEVAGDAAAYCDPSDSASIAEAIQGLLGDAAARKSLASLGHENARQFSWDRTAELTRAAYKRVLAG